jgi:dipeptidase
MKTSQEQQSKTRVRRQRGGCTTMIVGKDATADGSVIVAHSDDDVADERVIYVPEAYYPAGAMRPVYYDDCSLGYNSDYNSTELRRYIGSARGPGYNTQDFPESNPLGEIPQVQHTFAYFDSNYGIMNEHQLMIGECTCGAKFHPEPEPGKRIFYAAELSRVALERCTKATEAIYLIGDLIEKYGYYGTGETLLIGDPDEAWVMEMCGYEDEVGSEFDPQGTGGIWVAQRVPDDEYFVAANEFRIRTVREDIDRDSERMKYSANLFDVCRSQGWLKHDATEMDWLRTVSWGEYSHPYYSLRRVWRALSKAAPSLRLPAWVEDGYTTAYPFSIKPDKKLSVADVAAIYRDHYEGTEFDMTQGPAAGPFGDPTRYENNPDKGNVWNLNEYHVHGAWERPISIYRCGMLWINQGRRSLPDPIGGVCWIGLDRPTCNCLMPFYAGVTELPLALQTMNLLEFDRDSAWWAFNFVANYATIKYAYMIQDISAKQKELEEAAYKAMSYFERTAQGKSRSDLTAFCNANAAKVISEWWELSEALIVKYNDGCITTPDSIMQKVDYPKDWLQDAGYYKGPISYKKPKGLSGLRKKST